MFAVRNCLTAPAPCLAKTGASSAMPWLGPLHVAAIRFIPSCGWCVSCARFWPASGGAQRLTPRLAHGAGGTQTANDRALLSSYSLSPAPAPRPRARLAAVTRQESGHGGGKSPIGAVQRELGALASRTYAVLSLLRRRVQDLARRTVADTADAHGDGE